MLGRPYSGENSFIVKESVDSESFHATKFLRDSLTQPVFFEDFNSHRAIGNVFSTREHISKSLGINSNELVGHIAHAIDTPTPTEIVTDPLFKEKTMVVDLWSLPIPKYFPEDGGRYITSGIIISKQGDVKNASFHRMMVIDKNRLVLRLAPRHLHAMYESSKEKGEELKIAICIGSPLEVLLSAATSVEYGRDELEIASSMYCASRNHPLPTGMTDNGLIVPSESEYVLEGVITLDTHDEGPFVDSTGTYDIVRSQPVIRVDKIWTRDNPAFHLIFPGGPEHRLIQGIPKEVSIFKSVKMVVPKTHATRLTEGGCCWLHGVVSLTKNKEGDGKNAILAAFTGHASMKQVIIVDEDIDIFDDQSIEWAVATRFQGNNITLIEGAGGSSLDPSSGETTWKIGIDATIPLNKNKAMFNKCKLI